MAKSFNNFAQLTAHINKQVEIALKNDVANTVKEEMIERVEQDVYAKYTPNNGEPWRYERRRDKGGLSDVDNMHHRTERELDGVKLIVTNETKDDDTGQPIASLVEHGNGKNGLHYTYQNNRSGDADDYLSARPFQAKTIEELNSSGEAKEALKRGLRGLGMNVL